MMTFDGGHQEHCVGHIVLNLNMGMSKNRDAQNLMRYYFKII